MQEYNENRFNTAIERIREKCIKSPRSLRARLLNTLINKIGKAYNKEIHNIQKCQDRENNIRKKAVAPTDEEWDSLGNRRGYNGKQIPKIDIICPVYRGYDETLRCI